ncbi:hypothetical protein [Nocardia sp. NPDC057272]|uniref:hypothetical protein n=1 Tax=Nocardia sp. NPDC057272 TaxID=3346079 RepID=UPI0036390DBF
MTDSARPTTIRGRAVAWAIATTIATTIVAVLAISVGGGAVSALLAVRESGSGVLSSAVTAAVYVWLIAVPVAIGAGVALGIGLPATAFVRTGTSEQSRFLAKCGVLGIVGALALWPLAALGGVVSTTWTVHWLNDVPTAQVSHFVWMALELSVGQWSAAYTLLAAAAAAVVPALIQYRAPTSEHRIRRALSATAAILALCAILGTAHALYLNRPVTMDAAAHGSGVSPHPVAAR